jgi:UDP-glucose 4-epimerase
MKVLVTGVAGFIGSNLATGLLERGYEVVGLDNLSQGTRLNLETIASHPRFRFCEGDIRDRVAVERAADGCEVIVHLAAYKIPRYSDAYDTLMINAIGSETVARVAATAGAKIVAASTSDVYGKNPKPPFAEDMDSVIGSPDIKRWAYAISKMFEEQLLFACHDRFGIDVSLIRLFGGYGPHQNLSWWGGPQAVFIEQALEGRPLPIHGDGLQTRSFTYISDHVDGIIAVVESDHTNLVVNIGSDQEVTIRYLAELVWKLVRGDEPQLEFVPYASFGRYEDVMRRVPDLTRARELFGFSAKVGLVDGLKCTIAWQAERRQAHPAPDSPPAP